MIKPLQNLHLKVLSLLAAVVLWMFVVGIENVAYKFPENLDIRLINTGSDISVAMKIPQVGIYIKQDKELISTLTKNDFDVYVDLAGLGAGDYTLPVTVNAKSPQVRVMKIDPSAIRVKLAPSGEKQIKVEGTIVGKPATGFEVKELSYEFEKVRILGAQKYLDVIDKVQAKIILTGNETEDASQTVKLLLPDEYSDYADSITIVPEQILINVEIVSKQSQKKVPVVLQLANADNLDAWGKRIKLVPATVEISGDEKVIKGITSLQTEPVDVSKLGTNASSFSAGLVIPQGIKTSGNVTEVGVQVKEESVERKTVRAPVNLIGTNPAFNINRITPETVEVIVSGAASLINGLKPEDISINIDLAKLTNAGPVIYSQSDIVVPQGISVLSSSPRQITLE